jgi:hypothetical protein
MVYGYDSHFIFQKQISKSVKVRPFRVSHSDDTDAIGGWILLIAVILSTEGAKNPLGKQKD